MYFSINESCPMMSRQTFFCIAVYSFYVVFSSMCVLLEEYHLTTTAYDLR